MEESKPLTFYQTLEARMHFDPELIRQMIEFNNGKLAEASDPDEILELTNSDQLLRDLLDRLEL